MKRLFLSLILVFAIVFSTTIGFASTNGLFIGSDENGVNIISTKLTPGETYYFPILVATNGTPPTQLTAADLNVQSVSAFAYKGSSAIDSIAVEARGGLVYLAITPAYVGSTSEHTAGLRINLKNPADLENITITPELTVGHTTLGDEAISTMIRGDLLEVDNTSPIITTSQLRTLSSLNDDSTVTMVGDNWTYTNYVNGLGKVNMLYNTDEITKLKSKYPTASLHYLSFAGEPDFQMKGKLTIDMSDYTENYKQDMHVYRYVYNKLYPLAFDYDQVGDAIQFSPQQLSTYVISDQDLLKEKTDVDAISTAVEGQPEIVMASTSTSNPLTAQVGSSNAIPILITLGCTCAAAIACFNLKIK